MATKTKSKPKGKVWCQCAVPRPLLGAEGKPLSAEPICRKPDGCGYAIKRRPPALRTPPEPTIQPPSPGPSWTGPGQCPPPPETETEAYRRGVRLAEDPTSAPDYVAPAPAPISAPSSRDAERRAALQRLRLQRLSNSH